MNTKNAAAVTPVSNISSFDFSNIHTYGDLKRALPSTGAQRVPGIRQLRSVADVVLSKEGMSGTIEIYSNGFFTFEEAERITVCGVDRCDNPKLYCAPGDVIPASLDLDPYPWEMILEEAGAVRLDHNGDSREEYQSEISIDAPESENNLELSVKPLHEIREIEETEATLRKGRIEGVAHEIAKLSDDQRQLIQLYFVEKRSQTEVAGILGITQGNVSRRAETIKKRFEKYRANRE